MKKGKGINTVSDRTNVILNIIFILFSLACVIPFILVVSVSFTHMDALGRNGYKFIPEIWSLDAYRYIFKDLEVIVRAYGVTIFSVIVGTLLDVSLLSLYAYPLSRKDVPYKKFFVVYILITMLFSGGLAPTYMVYVTVLGLKNSIWALILPHLGGGFSIFIMRSYFKENIPFEVIESAKIDGAGELRIFLKLVLPLSVPVMAVMALFTTFGIWNDWMNSLYYISDPKLFSLQFVMQKALNTLNFIRQNYQLDPQLAMTLEAELPDETIRMAMVLVGIGPILLAYPFFQRFFIKGLTVGSIKG